jgi:hypothetical protein
MHILVMEFIGQCGIAAPKLRDAQLDAKGWIKCFEESVVLIRRLFHRKFAQRSPVGSLSMLTTGVKYISWVFYVG